MLLWEGHKVQIVDTNYSLSILI